MIKSERPTLGFRNNWEAAKAVRAHAESSCASCPPFTLLPYQHMSPEFCPWWLVPGPHPSNPAYEHGKLEIYQPNTGVGARSAWVGLYVEKGFGAVAARALNKPFVETLGKAWYWHSLIQSGSNRELDGVLDAIAARAGCDVLVEVSVGEANKPPADHAIAHDDAVAFRLMGEGASLDCVQATHGPLRGLSGAGRFAALAAELAAHPELDYY